MEAFTEKPIPFKKAKIKGYNGPLRKRKLSKIDLFLKPSSISEAVAQYLIPSDTGLFSANKKILVRKITKIGKHLIHGLISSLFIAFKTLFMHY